MNQDLRQRMERATLHRYAACMFDFDGTLVERGYHMPVPTYIPELLQQVSHETYMAICTTRPFKDAIKHAKELLGVHFEEIKSRWTWFCESGSAGYMYDEDLGDYREFYRVTWPEKPLARLHFEKLVHEEFAGYLDEVSLHDSVIILRPKDYQHMNGAQMAEICTSLEKKGLQLLKDNGLEDVIRLGNSSLGVFFFAPEGDKNRGTLEFGKLLRAKGVELSENFREIVLFGDRPMRHGNDEFFLNGELGTPVNVGEHLPEREDLISVIGDQGERMIGPRAVDFLLRKLKFKNM